MPKAEFLYECDRCHHRTVCKSKISTISPKKCTERVYGAACNGILRLVTDFLAKITSNDRSADLQINFNKNKPAKPPSVASVAGRCSSAPPVTTVAMPAAGKTIVANLTDPTWTGAIQSKIRLPYFRLDGVTDSMQGANSGLPRNYELPCQVGRGGTCPFGPFLYNNCDDVKDSPNRRGDGMHRRGGYRNQMSEGWIVNNIERMVGNTGDGIARGIKDDVSLSIMVRWPDYKGGSTNYYGFPKGAGGT